MHWKPASDAAREQRVASKLRPASKFYRFLWEQREQLFAGGLEERLLEAYAPRGQQPCPPAMLAMVLLLQRYEGLSDADAVDAAENDRRWQLVLGILGSDQAPFGQGTLSRFRVRLIQHDLDHAIFQRTVELAKETGAFGWKNLQVALDSSPLVAAGRVEDTWNLIGRAMATVVGLVGSVLGVDPDEIIEEAQLGVLGSSSVKAALDIDWDDETAKRGALQELLAQVQRLEAWVGSRLPEGLAGLEVADALTLLRRVSSQDTEPDPDDGRPFLAQRVARDRVVSVSDPQARHGRKSKTKAFNGYKRHVGVANGFVVATELLPANKQEHEATASLLAQVAHLGPLARLDIDRGYLASDEVRRLHEAGVEVVSRPWAVANHGLFPKEAFSFDFKRRLIVCPAKRSATLPVNGSGQATFRASDCGGCPLRQDCTRAPARSIKIHASEPLLVELRKNRRTKSGRRALRERVVVEHALARVSAVQGRKARYFGLRKNLLDLNRTAAIVNLLTLARPQNAA